MSISFAFNQSYGGHCIPMDMSREGLNRIPNHITMYVDWSKKEDDNSAREFITKLKKYSRSKEIKQHSVVVEVFTSGYDEFVDNLSSNRLSKRDPDHMFARIVICMIKSDEEIAYPLMLDYVQREIDSLQ